MSNYQKVNPSSGGIFGFPLYHLSGAVSPLARAEARKISFPYLAHSAASRGYLMGLMKNVCFFPSRNPGGELLQGQNFTAVVGQSSNYR